MVFATVWKVYGWKVYGGVRTLLPTDENSLRGKPFEGGAP